jgi:hypothetical protein
MSRPALIALLLLAVPLRADDEKKADEELLQSLKVGIDADALREFFRRRSPTPEQQAKIEALVAQLGHRVYTKRKQASQALVEYGPPAREALGRGKLNKDIEIARRSERCLAEINAKPESELACAAVRQFARLKPPGGLGVLLEYAPFADDLAVTDALLAGILNLANPKKADDALLKAAAARFPARRAAAAHVLGRHASLAARETARALLKDREAVVRYRAARALLSARDRAAVPVLIALLDGGPPEMRWQVEEILGRLPGCVKGAPVPPTGPDDYQANNLRQYRERWLAWWEKYGAQADLEKLDAQTPFLNVTVVPEMHAHKVWEFGPDGKVRWELKTDLKCPIDAQVLPGGRVLVAELEGGRVTERDRSGKILWKYNVQTPIYCRRMPDGNTFISTNNACLIVSPAGKEVFRYTPEQKFFIHSVQQMPNNHIVCISMDGDVREVDAKGKVLRTIPLDERGGWSGIQGLPGNRYLCVGNGRVREIDARGKVLWKLDRGSACFATRLPNGNTLVVDNSKGLVEVNRTGKVVWERAVTTHLWRAHRR